MFKAIVFFLITYFSIFANAEMANQSSIIQILITETDKLLNEVANPHVFTPQNCSKYLAEKTQSFYNLPSNEFIPTTKTELRDLENKGGLLLRKWFRLRLGLDLRLRDFEGQGPVSNACINGFRRAYLYLRYAEEFLAEILVAHRFVLTQDQRILADHDTTMIRDGLVKRFYAQFPFQPGDVLLIRGTSFPSATIARIADEEQYYSHMAIVSQNEVDGSLFVTEAVGSGVISTPLDKYINKPEARVALFRYQDKIIAQQAARLAYKLSQKHHLPYDFYFNENDRSEFFCAEYIQYVYELATKGMLILPRYRSQASQMAKVGLLQGLGPSSESLFAPSDIEVDTRFTLIADWRNTQATRQARIQDAVIVAAYKWMTEKNYRFRENSLMWLTKTAKSLRGQGYFTDAIPENIPTRSLNTMVSLVLLGKILEVNVKSTESALYNLFGVSLICKDVMALVEKLRENDCKLAQSKLHLNPGQFHWLLYNQEGKSCEQLEGGEMKINYDILISKTPSTIRQLFQKAINYLEIRY